jgi:hypothetical protein
MSDNVRSCLFLSKIVWACPFLSFVSCLCFREGAEKDHEDLEVPTLNDKDWPRTLESIQHWLRGCNGQTDIPLAYVICTTMEVPLEAADPATNYMSKLDEWIARTPSIEAVAANGDIIYNGAYLRTARPFG